MDTDEPFTVRHGHSLGLSEGQLRGSRFVAPAHGARAERDIRGDDPLLLRDAISALARDDQFFSHTTAAMLHGMPIPRALQLGPVHLASPSCAPRMRRPGVVGHRLKAEVVVADGLRVESPLDTLVHLATLLTVPQLVAVVDWVLQPRNGMEVTKAAIVERMEHFRGARGTSRLRSAVVLARAGAESPRESAIRLVVRGAGLPEPHLNLVVRDAEGGFVARVDLSWPDLRIALEYDGEQHRTDSWQYARDIERIAALEAAGWIVVRATKEHMRDPETGLLPRLHAAFARRARG